MNVKRWALALVLAIIVACFLVWGGSASSGNWWIGPEEWGPLTINHPNGNYWQQGDYYGNSSWHLDGVIFKVDSLSGGELYRMQATGAAYNLYWNTSNNLYGGKWYCSVYSNTVHAGGGNAVGVCGTAIANSGLPITATVIAGGQNEITTPQAVMGGYKLGWSGGPYSAYLSSIRPIYYAAGGGPTNTPTATFTPTATATETPNPTMVWEFTSTAQAATASAEAAGTATAQAVGTETAQAATATAQASITPTATDTSTETGTATATDTETPTASSTPTATDTPTDTPTATATGLGASPTPTVTLTPDWTDAGIAGGFYLIGEARLGWLYVLLVGLGGVQAGDARVAGLALMVFLFVRRVWIALGRDDRK